MTNFKDFGLPPALEQMLTRMNITVPTPIQVESIPHALKGADILASAQTGTGKTIAYLLPLIARLQDSAHGSALILAPTRELADQIKNSLLLLIGKNAHNDVALLIGGAPIFKQRIALKKFPKFIIGTPGRIIDHLMRGSLIIDETEFLVLDETDRMLDMGFSEALEKIISHLPKKRQTMMFSATMPQNIIKLSQKYLDKPVHIAVGSTTEPTAQIKQESRMTSPSEKFPNLLKELESRAGSIIIFVKTKIGADQLADRLKRNDHFASAIHGDLNQRKRDEAIRDFRNKRNRILVATDIAARGLDIPHIMHVINYDLPQCAEDYIHRIGRTGRAGMEGFALSFVSPEDSRKWRMINHLINPGSPAPRGGNGGGNNNKPSRHRKKPYSGGGRGGSGGSAKGGSRGGDFRSRKSGERRDRRES